MPQSKSQPQTPPSTNPTPICDPEYIAVILAATQGARLFPLTSEYPQGVPKHLLPLSPLNPSSSTSASASISGDETNNNGGHGGGGAPLLQRLLIRTYESGFEMVVVAIHEEDHLTVPFLLGRGIAITDANKEEDESNTKDADSETTTTGLCKMLSKERESSISTSVAAGGGGDLVTDLEFHGQSGETPSSSKKGGKSQSSSSANNNKRWMHVRVVRLPEDCHGSADALRFLSQGNNNPVDDDDSSSSQNNNESSSSPPKSNTAEGQNSERGNCCYIPRTSHAVVLPGDLITEGGLLTQTTETTDETTAYDGKDVLSLLVQAHRRWNAGGPQSSTAAACTMLLTDVGAEDKEGIPLKESSKAKMGRLSREEEDMEYVGLSSEIPPPLSTSLASLSYSKSFNGAVPPPSRRVVLKRSKLEVEEDEGIGSTPKLAVAKRRLHSAGANHRTKGKSGASSSSATTLAQQLLMGGLSMSATATVDHSPTISLRTDLHDVHLYVISNWVFELIHARPSMQSFQNEVLPLLISRQFRGVEAAFGPTAWKVEANRERVRKVLRELDGVYDERRGGGVACNKVSTLLGMYASGKLSGGLGSFIPDDDDDDVNPAADDRLDPATPKADVSGSSLLSPPSFPTSKHRFVVSAQVLSREASSVTLRACTLPSLLYGCSEVTSRTLKLDPTVSSSLVAKGARLSTKFNSILMQGCSVGEKVQTKACTIGKNVVLGDRAKLNNVVVMDGAIIGSNTVLQNSVVGVEAKIGENCNLKDCQVGPGAVVAAGTKTSEKGEAFHV
mmetsp:Transcript_30414/g.64377  ORF Transcript_30414/g.64377 Transcript_30414/m.64377 type:complete len:787 (-) Transcript_30414:109-2469(-)